MAGLAEGGAWGPGLRPCGAVTGPGTRPSSCPEGAAPLPRPAGGTSQERGWHDLGGSRTSG